MKNLLIYLLIITFVACDKSEDQVIYSSSFPTGAEFSIFNSQNEDLLNPNNPNHLDVSSIKIYYLVNGEKQEVFNPNYDNPRNYRIYKNNNDYRIGIALNNLETEEKSTTYIEWNDKDIDTIEVSYIKTLIGTQDKIWLNGKQIWDHESNTEPYFKLIK